MKSTLKYLIIFGVVYFAFKGYLFYRLNKTLREFAVKAAAEKRAKEERPSPVEDSSLDQTGRDI